MRCTLLRPVSGKEEDQSSSVWVLAEAQSHRVGPFPVARTAGLGARCDAAEQWCWWSGFPAASSTGGWGGGAAATEERGSLAMAPVFSSCLPSNSFVTIYFPILNPILLKIPGAVSTACAYFLTYLAFIPSLTCICTDDSPPGVPHSPAGDHSTYSKTQALTTTPCHLLP